MSGTTPLNGPGETPGTGSASLSWADVGTLRKRRDFLAASRARRHALPAFVLQARHRRADEASDHPVRVGYTCSKKVGNAVARNRAKRRLREAVRLVLHAGARPGWDYVLIGRKGTTAERPFDLLKRDLTEALTRIHAARKPR